MDRRSLLALACLASLAAACKTSAPEGPNTLPPNDAAAPGDDAGATAYDFGALHAELFGGAWKTEGVVVMVGGRVAYEEYAPGWDATKRHILYSASKSVGAALVGVAIDQGILQLSDSVCAYVAAPDGGADASLCDTTIEHLVQMRSGIAWDEGYESSLSSNVNPMLYGDEADMGAYTARQPRAAAAGSVWSYSSGDSNLLADALKGALAKKGITDARAWAKANLFDKAGMTSAIFESDRSGTLVFSSSLFTTPRDAAKFGQLFLDGGRAPDGTQVLSASWVAYSITPAPPVATPVPRAPDAGPGDSGGSYGAGIWLNAASPTAPPETWLYPDVPVDAFSFEGHWGQKVFVVPSRKLVVARVGNDRDPVFDPDRMVKAAVAAVDQGGAP